MKTRLVLGMIIAAIAMCISGVVEIYRQEQCGNSNDTIVQKIGISPILTNLFLNSIIMISYK